MPCSAGIYKTEGHLGDGSRESLTDEIGGKHRANIILPKICFNSQLIPLFSKHEKRVLYVATQPSARPFQRQTETALFQ